MECPLYVRDLNFIRSQSFKLHLKSLSLREGQVMAVTGQSGCGKSTLLECIGLLHKSVLSESFLINGVDVTTLNRHELDGLRRTAFGYMPQTDGLLPFLSVGENIKVQIDLSHKDKDRGYRERLKKQAFELVDMLNIGSLINKKPHEMSIGQRQRASFIRSISHRPSLLLIDEPTSALDPPRALELFSIIKQIVTNSSSAALVVTHDHEGVAHYGYDICSYTGTDENGASTFSVQGEL